MFKVMGEGVSVVSHVQGHWRGVSNVQVHMRG